MRNLFINQSRDIEEVVDDLEQLTYNDPEIARSLSTLLRTYHKKGLPYHELMRSKLFNRIKYLVKLSPDRTFTITDLDTNKTYEQKLGNAGR